MFNEALDIVLAGLSTGRIDYHGRYFEYSNVETRLRAVQRPYPPLWYPTSNADSVPWLASQGMSTVFSVHLLGVDQARQMLERYRQEYAAHGGESSRLNGHVSEPNYGLAAHVYVAESDDLAIERARESWQHFFESFAYLWIKHGEVERYRNRAEFDQLLAERKLLVGSPSTVREQLKLMLEPTEANYFLGSFSWGNFAPEHVLTSVELFAREVMPAFQLTTA